MRHQNNITNKQKGTNEEGPGTENNNEQQKCVCVSVCVCVFARGRGLKHSFIRTQPSP